MAAGPSPQLSHTRVLRHAHAFRTLTTPATQENRMKTASKLAALSLIMSLAAVMASAQQDYFSNWPKGVSPEDVGKRVAEHFVTSPHQYTATIHYSEAATWYGAPTYAQLTHDDALRAALIKNY